jgi:hypothetical protein
VDVAEEEAFCAGSNELLHAAAASANTITEKKNPVLYFTSSEKPG